MLDEHHRHPLVGQLTQETGELLGLAVILTRRGLVEEQHRRLAGEGTPQLHQPARSGRQRRDPDIGNRSEADAGDNGFGALGGIVGIARPLPVDVGRDPDVLAHGEHREQLEALEGAGQAAARPACTG